MISPPLDSTHGRTTSCVTCHHRLWKAHTVERRLAWHAIITFGQHKQSNDVGYGMPSCLWEAHTVERHRAWHDITLLGLHARLDDVGRGMKSPPLDGTHAWQRREWHDITTLGHHTRSNVVGRGMPSSPLESTNGQTTSGEACQHHLWAAHTVERRRA